MKLLSLSLVAGLAGLCCLPTASVAAELPDGRAYELVSPAEKSGNVAGTDAAGKPLYGLAAPAAGVAEENGEPSVMFGGSGPFGEGESGVDSLSVAHRSSTGWSTSAALPRGEGTPSRGDEPMSVVASSDLARVAFTALSSYGLGNPEGELPGSSDGLYLTGQSASLQWLNKPVTLEPDPQPGHLNGDLAIAGAAADLSTVYFTYYGTLLNEDLSRERVLEENGGANAFAVDWGFYEWHEGTLTNAGKLPDGSFSPYGAVPAATTSDLRAAPDQYANEVSTDGSHAFFVSPDPQACAALIGGCGSEQPQLYVRDGSTSSLVSRSEVLPKVQGRPAPAPDGVLATAEPQLPAGSVSYAFASPDGSRVFFESSDQLTSTATSGGEYEYDVEDETLTYLPAVSGPVLGSTTDGSTFVFENTASSPAALELSTDGQITRLSSLPSPEVSTTNSGGTLLIGPLRVLDAGAVVVFQTDAKVSGFNDEGGFEQIYRYDTTGASLECVSCPPSGVRPSGDATLGSDDQPGVAGGDPTDSSGVADDGLDVYFQSPDPLVPQDVNGKLDVYEWQGGSVSLLSSGTSGSDSFLLDNSPSGKDVFFTTSASLSPADTDGGYDVYDARVGGGFAAPQPSACTGFCGTPSSPLALLEGVPSGSETFPAGDNATSSASPVPPTTKPKSTKPKPKHHKASKKKHKQAKKRPKHSKHRRAG